MLTTAKRVPTDLPLVVRPSTLRWLLLFLLPALALCTPAVLLFTLWGLLVPGLFAAVVTIGVVVGLFGFHLGDWLWAGPLLAADERSVWVRAQRFPVRAVQVPWELIADIHPKRWVLDKALCIVTRDARAGRLNGAWGAIDQAKTSAFFRVPLVASTAMSDTSTGRALRTLTELSHGRATISGKASRAKRHG